MNFCCFCFNHSLSYVNWLKVRRKILSFIDNFAFLIWREDFRVKKEQQNKEDDIDFFVFDRCAFINISSLQEKEEQKRSKTFRSMWFNARYNICLKSDEQRIKFSKLHLFLFLDQNEIIAVIFFGVIKFFMKTRTRFLLLRRNAPRFFQLTHNASCYPCSFLLSFSYLLLPFSYSPFCVFLKTLIVPLKSKRITF